MGNAIVAYFIEMERFTKSNIRRFTIFFFFLLAYSYVEMNNFVKLLFRGEERIRRKEA